MTPSTPPPGGEPPDGSGGDATHTNLDALHRLAPGRVIAGRYRVGELLGMGAMGMVYRAHDAELEIDVALKVLRPELSRDAALIERFRREIVLARQVSHESVVRIHDLGKDGDLLFLSMDLVEGRSLRDVLEKDGPLEPERAVAICRQLAAALAVAHDRDIVHRDLKPSNVMLDDAGRALITDFGVARSLHSEALTGTGVVVGTPDYLAPEQYRGETLDGRCDVYALGVLLFEMITGRLPFGDGTSAESLARRLTGLPARVPELDAAPANLRHIIRRCLEPDRGRRYATARELEADLATLSRPRRQPLHFTGRTVAWVATAVVLAVFAAVVAWRQVRPTVETDVTPVARLETLAVLPFDDQTGRAELAWLGRGVPEILFESLVTSNAVQVVDPQRVFGTLRDLKLDPAALSPAGLAQAIELFDADRLLTGSIRADGDDLRLDARLVSADAPGGGVPLSVRAPLAEGAPSRLVAALEAALRDHLAVRAAPAAERPLDSPALPEYTEASRRLRQGDTLGARELLEAAVETDPDFGAAWLRLAQAYEGLGLHAEAESAADRAVRALGDGSDRLALAARARQARLAGDPERSQQILGELVARYPTDLETGVELADAFGAAGRFDEALARLEAVVAQAPNHPQAWYLRAKFSILSGASRVAVDDYLVRALVIQNKLRNLQGQADVLNAFGVGYRQLGELDQAQESYQRAAELRRELGDERGHATTLRNLAQIAIARGRFDDAEADLLTARDKLEALGDEAGMADLENELGMMEEARGRYGESLEHFRRALQTRRRLGDQRAIGESLNNIGFASHQLGRLDDAAAYWNQALEIFNDTGNRQGQVSVLHSLGQLQTTRGEWGAANQSYLQALELSRGLDWTPAIAASLGFLGRVALDQGRYAAALASFDDAIELFTSIDDARGRLEFGLARIDALLDLGETGEAEAALETLAPILEAVASADQRAMNHLLAARLATARGRADAARREIERAAAAVADGGGRAVVLRVELVSAAGSVDRLEEALRKAEELGDARLELETGEALLAARMAAGDDAAAREVFERLERRLRRIGDYAGSHRLYRLRRRLGDDAGDWEDRARRELERVGQDLTPEQVRYLEDTHGGA